LIAQQEMYEVQERGILEINKLTLKQAFSRNPWSGGIPSEMQNGF